MAAAGVSGPAGIGDVEEDASQLLFPKGTVLRNRLSDGMSRGAAWATSEPVRVLGRV